MSTPLAERLDQVVARGRGVLVLSAHLDDAVLSCGALLSRLAGLTPVTVATVFTEAAPPPHTLAARRFLGQCQAGDAAVLYAERRQEDVDALTGLGVEHVHFGVPDALFRHRQVAPVVSRLGDVVPEVVHRYPTYRFDIVKGRVSRGDQPLLDRLEVGIRVLADGIDAALVLAPIGVGRHVDHLLTRTLAERQGRPVVFYSDFPYDQRDSPDAGYLAAHGLVPVTWGQDIGSKEALVRAYRTQTEALFPAGIPAVPETYFLAPRRPGPTTAASPGSMETRGQGATMWQTATMRDRREERALGNAVLQRPVRPVRPPRAGLDAVALEQVLGAAWPGRPLPEPTDQLELALRLARANQVQGALARRYPEVLGEELHRVAHTSAAFDHALAEAGAILRAHGIDPVLIKHVPGADHEYSNFDLVVGAQLAEAVAALTGWGVRTRGHPLERTKIFVQPPGRPAAHLHQDASWWDVPSVDGTALRARATDGGNWLVPAPVDQLRIWVAHALFQNLAVDLSELLALRPLLRMDLVGEAAAACRLEGWERSFRRVVAVVESVIEALDDGASVSVPVRLPVQASVDLYEHVAHLGRTGRARAAAREAALRGPLLLAKTRRARLSGAGR